MLESKTKAQISSTETATFFFSQMPKAGFFMMRLICNHSPYGTRLIIYLYTCFSMKLQNKANNISQSCLHAMQQFLKAVK